MEIETISTQFIKPSCPTPKHLKIHKLSLLDQFMPSTYIPTVLFYSAVQSAEANRSSDIRQQTLKQLKESLSEVLTHFYPFAGRINDNKLSIDCNDEGVYYSEAIASYSLVEFFNQSNFLSFVHKLVPFQPTLEEASEGYLIMVQVTCFACGSMAIGALVSHMIADGATLSFFFQSWCSTSRRESQYAFPNFEASLTFPQNDTCPNEMAFCGQFLKKCRLGTRRFLFDTEAISKLKAKGSSLTVSNPTRVEVVSSFICKCVTSAFKANSGLERPTMVSHAVNLRRRASPTFPESCMGNFIWRAIAVMSAEEKGIELPELVIKMREAVTTINSDFVRSFQGEGGFVRYNEVLTQMVETASSVALTSGLNYVHYTSWCNFGLYDVDYGWGKPCWVSGFFISTNVDAVGLNNVLLMDTPSGAGIEAWLYLDEDDLTILQQDKELLTYATLDPNPLYNNSYVSNA